MSKEIGAEEERCLGAAVRFYFKGDSPANRENEDVRAMAAILVSERAQAREAGEERARHERELLRRAFERELGALQRRAEKAEKERDEARAEAKRMDACRALMQEAKEASDAKWFEDVYPLTKKLEAAEARLREVEQERDAEWKQCLSSALLPCTVHPTFKPGCMNCVIRGLVEARASVGELRAALEEIVEDSRGDWSINPGLNSVQAATALLARTETPKAIVEPTESASSRKE